MDTLDVNSQTNFKVKLKDGTIILKWNVSLVKMQIEKNVCGRGVSNAPIFSITLPNDIFFSLKDHTYVYNDVDFLKDLPPIFLFKMWTLKYNIVVLGSFSQTTMTFLWQAF